MCSSILCFEVCLLENVVGIKTVMDQIMKELEACGDYHIELMDLDPKHVLIS